QAGPLIRFSISSCCLDYRNHSMPGRSGTETKEQGKQMSHYRLNFDGDNPQLTVRKKPDLGFLIKNYQERHIGLNTDALTALMVLRQRNILNPILCFIEQMVHRGKNVRFRTNSVISSRALVFTVQTPVSMWRFIRFATRSEANSPLEVCLWERSRL